MAQKKKTDDKQDKQKVTIPEPRFGTAQFAIEGTAPLVMNAFPKKAREEMQEKQEAGSQAKKGKKREPKDFERASMEAQHISEVGWLGFPAAAFRNAMVRACSLVGFKMTLSKMSVFIEADGLDRLDGMPLVKITGQPEHCKHWVRVQGSTTDLRPRTMVRQWTAKLRVRFDEDQFNTHDVANLLMRVGMQVGVGEGRPSSPNSCGMGWGTFRVK